MFINTFIKTVYDVFTSKGNSRNKNLNSVLNYVSLSQRFYSHLFSNNYLFYLFAHKALIFPNSNTVFTKNI